MKYLILLVLIVPFITGCATTEDGYYRRQNAINQWTNMMANTQSTYQPPSQPRRYVYKNQYGQRIGSMEEAYY